MDFYTGKRSGLSGMRFPKRIPPLLLIIYIALSIPPAGNGAATGAALDMVWPTPNPSMMENGSLEEFVQPTVSGRIESGLWGCVRNNGNRFHEGLDLKPLTRDGRSEATDPVYSVMPGKVAYVNRIAGNSSYGRYVIVEHESTQPAVYTLYAHLAKIQPGLKMGQSTEAGTVLGVMGRSAGGYSIPRSRAHLHFEIGVRLSSTFQEWFEKQNFGSKNHHGNFNGMNLVGFNPLQYYSDLKSGKITDPAGFLSNETTALSLRIFADEIPDFVRRYPALVNGRMGDETLIAWDIDFTWYGLPVKWIPRYENSGVQGPEGSLQLLSANKAVLESNTCLDILDLREGGRMVLGRDLRRILELLFELY